MTIERTLIHPRYDDPVFADLFAEWRVWESLNTTHVIQRSEKFGLHNTDYLDDVAGCLEVGGQSGGACVTSHLSYLAKDSRVQNGIISVSINIAACIFELPTLTYVLKKILVEDGVKIGVINRNITST